MIDLIIAGGGGLCADALWVIGRINALCPSFNVVGVADDTLPPGSLAHGQRVLFRAGEIPPGSHVVLALGNPRAKADLAERLQGKGLDYPVVADPTALIAPTARLGPGCLLLPYSVAAAGARLGRQVLLGTHACVEHECSVGDFCSLYTGAALCGGASVGSQCELGTNSVLLPRLTLGDGCVTGAGAVVTKNMPRGTVAVGVPAVAKGTRAAAPTE